MIRRRSSSWDMHGGEMGIGSAFGNGSYGIGWCLPRLDQSLSALLGDLKRSRLAGKHDGRLSGQIRPHARNQCAWHQSRTQALADMLLGDSCRRRYSRWHRLRRVRQTCRVCQRSPCSAARSGATCFHSLGVPLHTRLGKDGFIRPLSTGEPLLELFG
jgi:hypothetical protein